MKEKISIFLLLVATWLWFGSTTVLSLALEDNTNGNICPDEEYVDPTNRLNLFKRDVNQYPTEAFTTVNASVQSYERFLDALFNRLVIRGDVRHGIPVLPRRQDVPMNQRFILVELSNYADRTVTLAMDVINAYVVGFRANNHAYFFRPEQADAESITHLFPDVGDNRQTFGFTGSYIDLQRHAGTRETIELGMHPLEDAISALHLFATYGNTFGAVTKALVVCIQMIPEAIRFPYIRGEMTRRIEENLSEVPNTIIIEYENVWGGLSRQIQGSTTVLNFEVTVIDADGQVIRTNNLIIVRRCIALMTYQCPPEGKVTRRVPRSPAVDEDFCESPEPTMHIVGPDGLCVDVRDGYYHNGNSIQLWPCASNNPKKQLWTFKSDGTIRSNGKCLTTYGYHPGRYVMIYDCSTAVAGATRWQVWENGTILNPESGLVLAATSDCRGTTLTVETNIYGTSQGWIPSNYTKPLVVSIVGFRGMCLEANDGSVWLENCVSSNDRQRWALYADGSIRLKEDQASCITSDADTVVKIASCSQAQSSRQRWWFRNDGTIWNLHSDSVLDVRRSDPSLKQIIMWTFTGNANQKWSAVP